MSKLELNTSQQVPIEWTQTSLPESGRLRAGSGMGGGALRRVAKGLGGGGGALPRVANQPLVDGNFLR